MNNPTRRLPAKPSEENLRKQAKQRAKVESIQLAQAQHFIATDYGCRNWGELIQLVEAMNRNANVALTSSEAKPNKPLLAAARGKDIDAVRRLLEAGQFTPEELTGGLAGALWYGDEQTQWPTMKAIADLLLEYGADVNGHFGTYGSLIFGTGECRMPTSLQYLIDNGADVTFAPIDTKYGKQCPLASWLGTYARGHNDRKHRGIEILLKNNAFIPPEVSPAILAVHRGDVKTLSDLIDKDPLLPRTRFRDMPYGNILLAGATLLHCAMEFGELECIDVLLDRWMEPNASADVIDGIGGQTPIYHAIAASNTPALEHFVKRLGFAIEGVRIRATWRTSGGGVQTTPMTPIEYAEKMSASPRELDLVRSTIWTSATWPPTAEQERTPRKQLERACRAGDFDAVKRLVESGELPVDQLHGGIEGCALSKHEDIARYLIDHGADINADYIENYGPVLVGFCEGLNDEGVEFVLKLGARADWKP